MQRVRDPLRGCTFNGAAAREARVAQQLRQANVAERAKISGAWLRMIENNSHDHQPSRSVATDIANALGVPLDTLLIYEDPAPAAAA